MLKVDVVVVGAGMVGASCALGLAQKGKLSIAMLDRSSAETLPENIQQANIRVSALSQSSVQLLKDLDVWQELPDEYHYPYQRMQIWDEMNDAELAFDAAEVGSKELGFIVDNHSLVYALQRKIEKCSQIKPLYSESISELQQDNEAVTLKLESGEQLRCDLLIAADGTNSWVRKALEIPVKEFEYEQQAIVVKIATKFSHNATAWQRYLSSGPVAVLPLYGNKKFANQGSIVWSAQNIEAERLMALSDKDFAVELQHALENRFGEIQLLSERQNFPLKSNIASRYVEGRAVLVGDAAHRIHPMAGQGVNLGFKDAAMLTQEVLAAHDSNRNISSYRILRRYERARKLDNQLTDQSMTTLHRLFGISNPGFAMLRGLGIKALNSSTMLKNRMARQAMGI